MSNRKKPAKESSQASAGQWEKEEGPTQAVVITDSFDLKMVPITKELPRTLVPLANRPLLDYTLDSLVQCGVQEIFVFVCSHSDKIKAHLRDSGWMKGGSSVTVRVITSSSTDCISFGDAMREIERNHKALLRGDFILVNGFFVGSVSLKKYLEDHKARRKLQKSLMMSVLLKQMLPGHRTRSARDDLLLAVDPETKRIIHYQKDRRENRLQLNLSLFEGRKVLDVHYDLVPCHVYICTSVVPQLFTDNFDFENIDDLICGVLVNDEIMGHEIHSCVLKSEYAASVVDLQTYYAISHDFLGRWTYPNVAEHYGYSLRRNNVYLGHGISLARSSVLKKDVMIGPSTKIDENTTIDRSILGSRCMIGRGVRVSDSIIWDDVVVEDGCTINNSILCSGAVLKQNVHLSEGCILSFGVTVGPSVSLPKLTRLSLLPLSDQQVLDPKVVGSLGKGYHWVLPDEEIGIYSWGTLFDGQPSDEEMSDSEDESEDEAPVLSDEKQFHNEVIESVRMGYNERAPVEKIMLEINASKYAYNMSVRDLTQASLRSILEFALIGKLPSKETVAQLTLVVKFFKSLLLSYIRGKESQLLALKTVDEFVLSERALAPMYPAVLSALYDQGIIGEDSILTWYQAPPGLEDATSDDIIVSLRQKYLPRFIAWLEESSESGDSSDSGD